ncbi:MAG: hypothetical protein P8182_08480 [Deltaproteobacteria bacterium]
MILDFQMNNLSTVEPLEKGLWRITARTDDDLFSAEVVLDVKAPALDIRKARLEIGRDVLGLVPDLSHASEKLVGVRVGPGMTKIVRGIVGAEAGSPRMAELVLEAMEMLVNALTVPELRKAAATVGEVVKLEHDGPKVFLNDVLMGDEHVKIMAENPRLKDSCVVFLDL